MGISKGVRISSLFDIVPFDFDFDLDFDLDLLDFDATILFSTDVFFPSCNRIFR
jgi:hypothetical protein